MTEATRPTPLCTCGKPRREWEPGVYAATCLGLECLHKFLGTRRDRHKQDKPVARIEPSDALAPALPTLLARKMKAER